MSKWYHPCSSSLTKHTKANNRNTVRLIIKQVAGNHNDKLCHHSQQRKNFMSFEILSVLSYLKHTVEVSRFSCRKCKCSEHSWNLLNCRSVLPKEGIPKMSASSRIELHHSWIIQGPWRAYHQIIFAKLLVARYWHKILQKHEFCWPGAWWHVVKSQLLN